MSTTSAVVGRGDREAECFEIERNCAPTNPPVLGRLLDRLDEALAETTEVFGELLAGH